VWYAHRERETETEMEAASHVVHRECRAAPLSPELSEQQNFRGLLNLGGLIIVRLHQEDQLDR
jgi:hypothetical protein